MCEPFLTECKKKAESLKNETTSYEMPQKPLCLTSFEIFFIRINECTNPFLNRLYEKYRVLKKWVDCA